MDGGNREFNVITLPYRLENDPMGIVVMGFVLVLSLVAATAGIVQGFQHGTIVWLFALVPLPPLGMALSLVGSTTFFNDRLVRQGLWKKQERTLFYRDIGRIAIRSTFSGRGTSDTLVLCSKDGDKPLLQINLVAINNSPGGQANTQRAAIFLKIITQCAPEVALNSRATEVLERSDLQVKLSPAS